MIFILGETEAAIFYWFSLTSLGISLIMFSFTIRMISTLCRQISRRGEEYQEIGERRGDEEQERRGGYGAFGFQTVL